jgi:hypothetical protein
MTEADRPVTDARLWHPRLRINRVLRVMLARATKRRVGADALARDAAGGVGGASSIRMMATVIGYPAPHQSPTPMRPPGPAVRCR